MTSVDMYQLLHDFVLCFIPIMVAMDAPGVLPLFLGMTHHLKKHERQTVVRQSIITAFLVTIDSSSSANGSSMPSASSSRTS